MTETNDDPVVFRFFNEIGIIEQLASSRLEKVLPGDLKMSHFVLLNHLARLGGKWSPARLASAFQVTRAAITNTMKRLESRGLIRIETDPGDGRGKLVSLTGKGRRVREQCIAGIGPMLGELQQQFGSEVFAEALPTLQALRQYLDENR